MMGFKESALPEGKLGRVKMLLAMTKNLGGKKILSFGNFVKIPETNNYSKQNHPCLGFFFGLCVGISVLFLVLSLPLEVN